MQINSINFAVIVIATSALASHAADEFSIHDLLRKKRYLVFPDPLDSETKVQVRNTLWFLNGSLSLPLCGRIFIPHETIFRLDHMDDELDDDLFSIGIFLLSIQGSLRSGSPHGRCDFNDARVRPQV